MAKRLLKTLLLPILALATALAFIACDGETIKPDVKYHVTYSIGADATGTAPTETDKAVGEKFKLKSADGITCEGMEFMGWSDGNITYKPGDEYIMPSKAVTFTAQWAMCGDPATYPVTYDLNGGTGETPAQSYKGASETFTLASADGFSYEGKEFDGWSDGENKYDAGAEYTMSGKAVVFTAQWKDASWPEKQPIYSAYELDYKGTILLYEDNTGALDYYSESEDEQILVEFTYTLDGTAIAITIGGNTVNGTYVVTGTNKLLTIQFMYASTLFKFGQAQEQPVGKPTVTFNANGGTGSAPVIADADIVAADNNQYTIVLPECTYTAPENKEFDKWEVLSGTKSLGTYAAGYTFRANAGEKLTLKATWKDSLLPATEGIEFYGNCTLPTKQGLFGQTSGGETVVKIIIDNSDEQKLKVTYNLLDDDTDYVIDEVGMANLNYLEENPYDNNAKYYGEFAIGSLNYNIVINSDFTKLYLCNTNDELLDDGEFTTDGGSSENPPENVTVTFNLGYVGGTTIPSQTIAYGGKVTAPPAPTRDGYVFGGWRKNSVDGEAFDFEAAVTANVVLVAKWLEEFTVTYVKPNGVTGDIPEQLTVADGTQVLLPEECPFAKSGWTFRGWSVTGYSVLRASNTKIIVTQNTTVTPVFSIDYTGDIGNITVLDNDTLMLDGETYSYISNGDIIDFDCDGYLAKIKTNNTTKTYTVADGMNTVTFTADNNATLTFDGFGTATLGTHAGTYTIGYDSPMTVTLVFGDYTSAALELKGEYPNYTITVTITLDDTDYVFGDSSGEDPNNPPASNDKLADYASADTSGIFYGYASVDDAKAANEDITATNSSNAERTFYQAKVFVNFSGNLSITITANTGSVSNPKDSNNANIAVTEDTLNQTVYITSASWANQFVITFSKNSEGKRVMKITYGDITVTWVEMNA